jgi:hypothetical protein
MYHLLQRNPCNPQIQQKTFQLQTPWKPIIYKPKNNSYNQNWKAKPSNNTMLGRAQAQCEASWLSSSFQNNNKLSSFLVGTIHTKKYHPIQNISNKQQKQQVDGNFVHISHSTTIVICNPKKIIAIVCNQKGSNHWRSGKVLQSCCKTT